MIDHCEVLFSVLLYLNLLLCVKVIPVHFEPYPTRKPRVNRYYHIEESAAAMYKTVDMSTLFNVPLEEHLHWSE